MKRLIAVAVLVLSGCGATLQQLKARAAVDLDCDAEHLALQPIDDATQKVAGCGKSAVYVQLFNNNRFPTWALNSNVRDTTAKSPSP
jgi:hypothetical protein